MDLDLQAMDVIEQIPLLADPLDHMNPIVFVVSPQLLDHFAHSHLTGLLSLLGIFPRRRRPSIGQSFRRLPRRLIRGLLKSALPITSYISGKTAAGAPLTSPRTPLPHTLLRAPAAVLASSLQHAPSLF